jgi:hypothetical protein
MEDLKPKLLIICMLAGCLIAAGTAKATEKVTITVSEDAHVGDTFPNSNFGSSTNLYVGDVYQNDPIQSWRSYLKFDLSSIPRSTVMTPSGRRTGTVVTSARLYVGHSGTGPSPPDIIVEAHYCDDDSWTEYGITWLNAPAYDNSCTDRHKLPRYESCCNCWCLTEDVQTALDEDGILSVVFDCTGEGYDHRWATLDSRENNWTYAPYLVVEYEEGDLADPNVKWEQMPALEPYGMDIDMSQVPLADDFNCTETGPIEVIRIWGSFFNDVLPEDGAGSLSFRLKFFDNIPAVMPGEWSMPGMELWAQEFGPGDYTVQKVFDGPEDWYEPLQGVWYNDDHNDAYLYTFYIDPSEAFEQQGDPWNPVIYWLGVEDITPPEGYQFGWKSAVFPWWGDDGVYWDLTGAWMPLTYPPNHEFQYDSVDLAFAIIGHREAGMDLGDAPDSSNSHNEDMEAYTGVQANYPTVYTASSPPYGPLHRQPKAVAYLGKDVSLEVEADIGPDEDPNNNIDPPNDDPNQDGDDDGVDVPLNLPHCRWTTFKYDVNVVDANVDLYVNVWFDWNRDGDWDDSNDCNDCNDSEAVAAPEWAVKNQLLISLNTGLNTITTPAFLSWHPQDGPEEIWMRITLSERPWRGQESSSMVGNGGSGPRNGYEYGETEDYYFEPDTSCSADPDLNCDGKVNFVDLAIFANQWLRGT